MKLIKNVEKKLLSSSNGQLIQFEFSIADHLYKAYMKDGNPILEIHQNDTVKEIKTPKHLAFIAEIYYKEQLTKFLNTKTQDHIHFELKKINGKIILLIKLATAKEICEFNHDVLLSKLKNFGKFTINKASDATKLVIQTNHLDLIETLLHKKSFEAFYAIIDSYLKEGNFSEKKKQIFKRLGSKYPRELDSPPLPRADLFVKKAPVNLPSVKNDSAKDATKIFLDKNPGNPTLPAGMPNFKKLITQESLNSMLKIPYKRGNASKTDHLRRQISDLLGKDITQTPSSHSFPFFNSSNDLNSADDGEPMEIDDRRPIPSKPMPKP